MAAQAVDARFERYSTCNDQPSAEDLEHIRCYVARPRQELEEVNWEIEELENRLTSLRTRKDTLHGIIRKYSAICSPIRGLPQDVLGEIFVHCLPHDRFSALHVADAPLLLTIICRRWRDTALRDPRLWTKFHIVTNLYDTDPGRTFSGEEHLRVAEGQAALLQHCASGSGSLPLQLSISDRSKYSPSNPSPVISLVGKLLPRTRSLRWDAYQPFHKFLASQPADSFSLLEGVSIQWEEPPNTFDPSNPPCYFLAPKPHDVRIQNFEACPSTLPLQWKRLTRLALPGIEHVVSINKLIPILKTCPKLQEGLFYVSGEQVRWGECALPALSARSPPPTPKSILLPELWSLGITHQDCIGVLLAQLHHNEECLPLLEKLVVRPGVYYPQVLVTALERLPRLRTLILLDKDGSSFSSPTVPKSQRQGFDEDMLVRMTPQVPPSTSPSCLCPLLERFEFREGANYIDNRHLALKTVVSFVSGKWEAAQIYPGQVSSLKHITVPTRTLPNGSVKKALKAWRERGLVVEIAHPDLDAAHKSEQYDEITEESIHEVESW